MAELEYALVLGTNLARVVGSSPTAGTNNKTTPQLRCCFVVIDGLEPIKNPVIAGFVFRVYADLIPIFPLPKSSFLGIFIVKTPLSICASALSISMFSGKTIFLENGPQ